MLGASMEGGDGAAVRAEARRHAPPKSHAAAARRPRRARAKKPSRAAGSSAAPTPHSPGSWVSAVVGGSSVPSTRRSSRTCELEVGAVPGWGWERREAMGGEEGDGRGDGVREGRAQGGVLDERRPVRRLRRHAQRRAAAARRQKRAASTRRTGTTRASSAARSSRRLPRATCRVAEARRTGACSRWQWPSRSG